MTTLARTSVQTRELTSVEEELSRITVVALAVVSTTIGAWGLACFVGGMVASGGPLAFIGNWFRAVSGL